MSAQLNARTYLQKLQTIAYLSLGAPLLFFIYIYLESSVDQLEEIIASEYHMAVFLFVLLTSLAVIYWSMKKYKNFIKDSLVVSDLKEKLNIYQLANKNRFIIYGVSAMLISIGFYLTNFQPFAALFGIMIVLFSFNNPNTRRIVGDLKLKNKDKEIILDGLDIP